jgi:tetratricopeptide (TPR) repeat protein
VNTDLPRHRWISGGLRRDRERLATSLTLAPDLVPAIDAHRHLRGPYTATGTLVRALAAEILERAGLARRYDIEILSVAPELSDVMPCSRETLTSMAIPSERTRFYARLRTARIANGVAELLLGVLPDDGPRTLVVENAEHAEHTDLEVLATALRRIDPARLTLVVCGGDGDIAEPLRAALDRHTDRLRVAGPGAPRPGSGGDLPDVARPAGTLDAARAYVGSDGTSDEPALLAAYEALDVTARTGLHDERAGMLDDRDEQSLRLGALPYHLLRGSDPRGAGAQAAAAATDYCVRNGFYTATVELGQQGLAVAGPADQPDLWWKLTTAVGLSLSILSRTRQAQRLYEHARSQSILPKVHMAAAYSIAMLYTRHNDPRDKDELQAKAWLNSSIATASLLEDPTERAFLSAFYRNGLALVEVNLGDPEEALRLVDGCIESLDRLLTPDQHRLHRAVLKNNRARVYSMLGRFDEALADYAVVIEADPNHAEHYLERGSILRRLGRDDEAEADYARAIRLSPPFPEIYYNRADLRLSRGDRDGALADFSYALELDPDLVDAYINRAGIHLANGDLDSACADARHGLRRDPANAYLHAVLGEVEAGRGHGDAARAAYDQALDADPGLVTAWAGRAAVAWDAGDQDGALRDLTRAVELAPADPALRFNRATIHSGRGRWHEALLDLDAAAGEAPDDPDIAAARQACLQHVGGGPGRE